MIKSISRSVCALAIPLLVVQSPRAETLAQIYQLAVVNDPQLRAAEAALNIGKEAIPSARAGLLPTISASAEVSDGDGDSSSARFLNSSTGGPLRVGANGENDDETESYSLSLSQPLFDLPAWFTFKRGYDLDQQARAEFAAEQQELIVRTVSAYTGVLRASENLITSQAEQRAIGRQLEQTKERFDVGLLPITDVHEAQAAYDDAVVNTLEAEGALDIAFEALEVITGQRHERLAGLAAEFPTPRPEPVKREAWVAFAQKNNFSLEAARLAMMAAEKNAKAKRAERLPKVKASLSYTNYHQDGSFVVDGSGTAQPFSEDNEPTVFAIRMDAPLYTGGLISSEMRRADQEYIRSQENHLLAQRTTTQEARSEHLNVNTDSARVRARAQAITSAESALEATQAGYDVGTRNIVDLLISQRVLYQAQRDYANARFDYIMSLMKLKQVAGLLSPEDIEQLDTWMKPELVVGKAASQAAQ